MQFTADRLEAPTAIRTDLGAIFISLELSRSSWVVTSLSPGGGEKMSKHTVRGGDVAGLLKRFAQLREKAKGRTGKVFPLIVIQEAGLDGFCGSFVCFEQLSFRGSGTGERRHNQWRRSCRSSIKLALRSSRTNCTSRRRWWSSSVS
jgi:hypothetical protein